MQGIDTYSNLRFWGCRPFGNRLSRTSSPDFDLEGLDLIWSQYV